MGDNVSELAGGHPAELISKLTLELVAIVCGCLGGGGGLDAYERKDKAHSSTADVQSGVLSSIKMYLYCRRYFN